MIYNAPMITLLTDKDVSNSFGAPSDKFSTGEYKAEAPEVNSQALVDFRAFLERNRDDLRTGMGAFHHDGHSNW